MAKKATHALWNAQGNLPNPRVFPSHPVPPTGIKAANDSTKEMVSEAMAPRKIASIQGTKPNLAQEECSRAEHEIAGSKYELTLPRSPLSPG